MIILDNSVSKFLWNLLSNFNNIKAPLKNYQSCICNVPNIIVKMARKHQVTNLERKCSNAYCLFLTHKKCSK